MNISLIFSLFILFCFIFYFLLGFINEKRTKKQLSKASDNLQARNCYVEKALQLIISCNSYPPMAIVFRNINDDLEKYNIIVNKNFKGYFKNEERAI